MTYRVIKPSRTILRTSLAGIWGIWPLSFLLSPYAPWQLLLVMALIWLCGISIVLVRCTTRRFIISEKGVEYKSPKNHHVLAWSEIQSVGVGYVPFKGRGRAKWIYFTTNDTPLPIIPRIKDTKDYIMVHYRPAIGDFTKKYWEGEIDGLHYKSKFEEQLKIKIDLT